MVFRCPLREESQREHGQDQMQGITNVALAFFADITLTLENPFSIALSNCLQATRPFLALS